jgi:hypothetical protein
MVQNIGKIPVSFNLLDVSGELIIDDATTPVLVFYFYLFTNGLMHHESVSEK